MTRRSFSYAWLFGAALLALVVGGALHVSGSHEFIVLAERAGPWWMGLALLLQLETYIAQGVIWRKVAAAAGAPLRRTHALALSLAKLFADQALPSGGISGSLVVARALRRRGMRDEAVNAAVLINVAAYHIAYVIALGVALAILTVRHRANTLIVATSILFVAFAIAVNDAPAMHAADTSLSVDQAVDVAKESADFVLLERGLDVIRRGVEEGRRTFANTLKYILTTTSANLGNMLSMAGASLFLPFLPLLPGQILLNNFVSDIPAVGIADDSVDPERKW